MSKLVLRGSANEAWTAGYAICWSPLAWGKPLRHRPRPFRRSLLLLITCPWGRWGPPRRRDRPMCWCRPTSPPPTGQGKGERGSGSN